MKSVWLKTRHKPGESCGVCRMSGEVRGSILCGRVLFNSKMEKYLVTNRVWYRSLNKKQHYEHVSGVVFELMLVSLDCRMNVKMPYCNHINSCTGSIM